MRAAIYARYSSNNQREASLEDQVRLCQAFIDRQGWDRGHVYTDRAASGASPLRAGYQQLLQDARAGAFNIVVAEALDRLSRDLEDVAGLYKHLTFAGVQLVTLAEGEINELHVGLKGTMNALYLKDLAQKTHRGLEGRVRQGKSGGGLCYGYEVVRGSDSQGEPIRGERKINPSEAETVRRIFREFAAGRSPRSIAKRLNAEGISGPHGRVWRDTAIRGHVSRGTGILNNELYIGRLIWNRRRYIKDPATGKRLARPNAPEDWVIQEVPDLRIVSNKLWLSVKARQQVIADTPAVKKIKQSAFWKQRRAKHLLTGRVQCGACGSRFAAVGRDYLACSAARGRGTCANTHSVKRSVLEGLILDGLKQRLMAPELLEEFIGAFTQEVNRQRRDADMARAAKDRELSEISQKLDGLIDAIAEGFRSESLQTKLTTLEARKTNLEAELAKPVEPPVRLHPNLGQVYRQKVEDLQDALNELTIRDEALDILRGLIDHVVMHATKDGFEVELIGEIAKMVELGQQKKAALPKEAACSVKVVAGAGFEPATFRL